MTVKDGQTSATVSNLKEGEQYQFRIVAKNKAGKGQPSDPSDSVICKTRFCKWILVTLLNFLVKPHIHREDLTPMTIKVGQPLSMLVKVDGEPPPTVTWTLKDQPIYKLGDITAENPEYSSKLLAPKAMRKHSGVYKVVATNTSGTDEAEVEINVIGE